MKKLGVFAVLLSLGLFSLGCTKTEDPAPAANGDSTEAPASDAGASDTAAPTTEGSES